MQRAKAKEARKHHYVPVFYQLNFASSGELLWVYDRQLRTYKELHPRVICFEKDLYAVKPENKPRDSQIESKVLVMVDGFGSKGIHDFDIDKPTPESTDAVALFAAFQYTRVPTISRDVRATYAAGIQQLSRMSFANVERAKAIIERYERETGESLNITPESMVADIQGKHLQFVATEVPFLTNMLEQAVNLSKVITGLSWEILIAPDDTGFIICDCPLVVVPQKGRINVGFLVPGCVKYFPLTRRLCLRLGEAGKTRKHRRVDKKTVRIINQNIAANSERFIMGPSRLQLENVVTRSGCREMESTPRFIMEIVEADDDSALQKITAQPRRYFYAKDGSHFAP
jgi:hypothetical protein